MALHTSILLFKVPDSGFEGAVFIFGLIDEAFECVIFVPDKVLGCLVAIKVDAGAEDVVVRIDFFPQLVLIAYSFVQILLPCLEGPVLTP